MAAPPSVPVTTRASDSQKSKHEQTQPADQPKKMSAAELKAQKQAEKAKRRAAAIAAKEAGQAPGGAGVQSAQAAPSGGDGKGGKPKTKEERPGISKAAASARPAAAPRRPSAGGGRPAKVAPEKHKEEDVRSTIPECFSHLPMARRITLAQAEKDVHPAMLALGQQMATFALRDNIARLEATLLAFKKVLPLSGRTSAL